MPGGYMGKLLFVNLSTGEVTQETPDESLYRDFIGGYGLGARILYSHQRGGVDPLGPENTFGVVTGPLTGTPVPFGCRFAVVAKSPLTGGWGDANSGGYFGPYLKFAGYDGVFFTGISEMPVYLFIDNGKTELKDASHLWGKSTYETEEALEAEYGPEAKVASIGPAGVKLSLIASIMTNRGDALGRSGLGAVMGSKKLKAVVARGNQQVPLADTEAVTRLRKEQLAEAKPFLEGFRIYGTAAHADMSAHSGDTPVKNWGGVGVVDLPDVSGLDKDLTIANLDKRKGCWHCPALCKGSLKEGNGEYRYPVGTHRPEYETIGAFGANCLNTNIESIKMVTHLCNSYGMDTISAGSTIAFAMECYDNGLITSMDTDGIDLTWGNYQAIVAMTEKMVKREDFGDVLADGVKRAAERIGKGAEEFAVHIGGQELGMHDPKGNFMAYTGKPMTAMYHMDATPGRHTTGFGPTQFMGYVLNAAGLCLHGNLVTSDPDKYIVGFMAAVTGLDRSREELLKIGERIGNIRHVFTLREGDNPLEREVHGRIVGRPPQEEGPLAGVSEDIEAQDYWNLGALDWDRFTTRPSKEKLLELGLDDVAEDLWQPWESGDTPE
ncbi:MAG: aldehyde ferredoxin oxidoreductase family protein [Dehalococcoidia bacterium]